MNRALVLAVTLIVSGPPAIASAQINLSWNDCLGSATSSQNMSFTCSSGAGQYDIAATFVAPDVTADFLGVSTVWYVRTAGATLPSWWMMGAGECRQLGLGVWDQFDWVSCAVPYSGTLARSLSYESGFGAPNRARILAETMNDPSVSHSTSPGEHTLALGLILRRSKTTGVGSCPGCAVAACIELAQVTAKYGHGSTVETEFEMNSPVTSQHITWQGGPPKDVRLRPRRFGHPGERSRLCIGELSTQIRPRNCRRT